MPAEGPPAASVVIPTHNRLGELVEVIAAVQRQVTEVAAAVEVVVVDDGSGDGTGAWLEAQARCGRLRALGQPNAGPARARNAGVRAAKGELILFLGDDTVPRPGWLREHLETHRVVGGHQLAVLGYTTFPPSVDSPFRRFINEWGAQFGYLLLETAAQVPFNFFYTSNISLRRRVLLDLGGFREDFPAAAWEDIELAYRAVAGGLEILYQPRARVLHHHRVQLATFCHRQRTSGRSAAIFARLHPELGGFLGFERMRRRGPADRVLDRIALLAVRVGENLPGVIPLAAYRRAFDGAYLRGLAESLQ